MPAFPAPRPVPVVVDVPFGNLHVVAGDRDDVVVTVLPTDAKSGSAMLTTSYGSIEVGVPEGVAAYVDVASEHGSVRNHLAPTEGPVEHEVTAEIHAGTGYGDIIVRRP